MTGGAGFIGSNLCRSLLATNGIHSVSVIDDFSTGSAERLRDVEVDLIEGSVLDPTALSDAIRNCNTVIHLAALPSVARSVEDPRRSHEVNASGTLAVLEAARQAGNLHTILAGSSSVYGSSSATSLHERLPTRPVSPYAASKLAAEAYALAYASSYHLPVLSFRFFNVYGPHQQPGHAYAAVIPSFIHAALNAQPLPVHGDGTQSRDFTFVDSVTAVIAQAVVRIVTNAAPVNLAFGTNATLLSIIDELETLLDRKLERVHQEPRVGDVAHSCADSSRLRELFADLRPIDIRDGLRATLAWMRDLQPLAR